MALRVLRTPCILYYLFTVYLESIALDQKNQSINELLRKRRYLLYPNPLDSETKVQVLFGLGLPMEGEVSMTLGYVLKCNYNLPYNSTDFTKTQYQRDNKYIQPMTRWDLYRLLESALDGLGSGKACLLRAVCEAAEGPFNRTHGLLGELLHVLLLPSSTKERIQVYEDQEYHAAEVIGKSSNGLACKAAFSDCVNSPLDFFSMFQ